MFGLLTTALVLLVEQPSFSHLLLNLSTEITLALIHHIGTFLVLLWSIKAVAIRMT